LFAIMASPVALKSLFLTRHCRAMYIDT
jgi:hypothetical protein